MRKSAHRGGHPQPCPAALVMSTRPLGGSLESGSNWGFQYWYRDGSASNFSSALSVTFCP